PYLPPATLRELLTAPSSPRQIDVEVLGQALTRVGLQRLVSELDTSDRWGSRLNEDEQRSLAVARALAHAPAWLIIDELFEGAGQVNYQQLVQTLSTQLPHTALVYIGGDAGQKSPFDRVLQLVSDPRAR